MPVLVLVVGGILWLGVNESVLAQISRAPSASSAEKETEINKESSGKSSEAERTKPDENQDKAAAGKDATDESAKKPKEQPKSSDSKEKTDKKSPPAAKTDTTAKDAKKGAAEEKSDKPEDKEKGLEALNLKDVPMKDIIPKLAEWTGKVIIPDAQVLGQKLTIYSSKKMPREKALSLIYAALRIKGYIPEQDDSIIYLKPIKDAKMGLVPLVPPEQPLAALKDKSQIVQKFFQLEDFSPTELQKIIQPLIPTYGHVAAEEKTKKIVIIDTVENLLRIEKIVQQLDMPEADASETVIFEIHQGDPGEIVQLLRILLSEGKSGINTSSRRNSRRDGRYGRNRYRNRSPSRSSGGSPPPVITGGSNKPIVLIPEPQRKWIIAQAIPSDMERITKLIEKLDKKETVESEYVIRDIQYVEVRELADQINSMLEEMPGRELQTNVVVQPLNQTRQVMIVGSEEHRNMVEKLIEELDIETKKFETKHIKLKYTDPEKIKKNIDDLYGEYSLYESSSSYGYGYRSRSFRSRSLGDPEMVKVIAYPARKQVTVIASASNIEKVEKQIKEWDKPIDPNEVRPRFITVHNLDPVKTVKLLTRLFSEEDTNRRRVIFDFFGGGRRRNDQRYKIVGPLYGQLTFEAVEGTRKIIVISKVPEAYEVIEELVAELDAREPAEVPLVKVLKYADCEDLCEQLNAMFNERGVAASVRRRARGLSEYSGDDNMTTSNNQSRSPRPESTREDPGTISGPWSRARSREGQELPLSNIIGKVRFIPAFRSKAIMVMAPKDYLSHIEALIDELDQPAKQVIIKAIIVEVNHNDLTSLGVKLSTNPAAFGGLTESAVQSLAQLKYSEQPGNSFKIDAGLDVSTLVDFLVKNTRGRILNQPTLWSQDNEEAVFFKGRYVPFLDAEQTSSEGIGVKTTVKYEDVGLTLQTRPNITPTNNVDMNINLTISQVEPEQLNGNIVISKIDTSTHMIVEDGQTILISGILLQQESETVTKVPLLGDIPLLGELFKHYDTQQSNVELLAFVTPYVIDEEGKTKVATIEELESSRDKMEVIRQGLNDLFDPEKIENSMEKQ